MTRSLLERGLISASYADAKPDEIALTNNSQSRTFSLLHMNANRLANGLAELGLRPGDAVALLSRNRVEFVETFLATQRLGVRLTPVNWHLAAGEAAYIIENCEAKVLITEKQFLDPAFRDIEALQHMLVLGDDCGLDLSYSEVVASASSAAPERSQYGTVMLYTSGTTGRPKGVYRKRPTIIEPQGPGTLADYRPHGDIQILTGPAYHAAPLLFDLAWPLASGVPIHMISRWDSEQVLSLIESKRVTHTHMVPIMFQRLLAVPENIRANADVSSLRRVFHGAAPCDPQVKRAMIDWLGPILFEYYAGSEGGAGFNISSEEWLAKPGSVGKVPDGDVCRLLSPDGSAVAPGEEGEIFHRMDPENPFEYFKDAEKMATQTRDGFFSMGDIGRVDEDGYLFLTGRSAECIISGGVNIYPREIDEIIARHPAVIDVCTIGVPSEQWGEDVCAVIQLKPGQGSDDTMREAITWHARGHLAGFKVPKRIDFVEELPRLPSGKIPRATVRAPYWADQSRKI
jgi:long-chain acyl-CoA synthetase